MNTVFLMKFFCEINEQVNKITCEIMHFDIHNIYDIFNVSKVADLSQVLN